MANDSQSGVLIFFLLLTDHSDVLKIGIPVERLGQRPNLHKRSRSGIGYTDPDYPQIQITFFISCH